MLSATADHALRAVLFLARQPAGRVTPADEIAEAIGAPRNYLSKTLYTLAKAGIVASSAGRTGGFSLAVAPGRLSLQRLIGVFEEKTTSTRCLLGDRPCNKNKPCAAHNTWTAINRSHDEALASTTVADLLEG